MGREKCTMCDIISGQLYCGYKDYMYLLCSEEKHCPEGLDDDNYEDNNEDTEDDYPEEWINGNK